MSGITLPYDVADSITLTVLQDHLGYLREELKNHRENNGWMHSEDVRKTEEELIPALETLIRYFGGEL